MAVVIQPKATSHGVGVDKSGPVRRILTFWVPMTLFVVLTLFPFYWMLVASLKPNNELYNLRVFPFWVFNPTLDHYRYLFEKTLYFRWLMNTLLVAVASTAISLAFGILAGYALARLRFWGASILGVAGKIVSVEARHVALLSDLLWPGGTEFAPEALDAADGPRTILKKIDPYVVTKLDGSRLPDA